MNETNEKKIFGKKNRHEHIIYYHHHQPQQDKKKQIDVDRTEMERTTTSMMHK